MAMSYKLFFVFLTANFFHQLSHSSNRCDELLSHSIEYFLPYWDHQSKSFPSEISFDGQVMSSKRYIIATSRMLYGLSHGSTLNARYLNLAQELYHFIKMNMMVRDELGPYFLGVVDTKEQLAPSEILVVNEQAYGFNGLVALYQTTRNPELLELIEQLYFSFKKRFYDTQHGGFFDQFNLTTKVHNQTKSYSSTVYLATSFLLELAAVTTGPLAAESHTILKELADIVANRFPDQKTGFIFENFDYQWNPVWRSWQSQPEGTIGVAGHNFQAAWFLMRVSQLEGVSASQRTFYRDTAKAMLISMLSNNHVMDDVNGGIGDVFVRETGQPMWHTNKAWWQQAEAILALTLAQNLGILQNTRVDKIKSFFDDHFVDHVNGGEFSVVTKEGAPVPSEMKGHAGKSTYHTVELARYMKLYDSQWKHLHRQSGELTLTIDFIPTYQRTDQLGNSGAIPAHNVWATPLWLNIHAANLSESDKVSVVLVNYIYERSFRGEWVRSIRDEENVQIISLNFVKSGHFSARINNDFLINKTNNDGYAYATFRYAQEVAIEVNGKWFKDDSTGNNLKINLFAE